MMFSSSAMSLSLGRAVPAAMFAGTSLIVIDDGNDIEVLVFVVS